MNGWEIALIVLLLGLSVAGPLIVFRSREAKSEFDQEMDNLREAFTAIERDVGEALRPIIERITREMGRVGRKP